MEGILIPVKSSATAKGRLGRVLNSEQRRRLQLAMFADVLRAIEKWDLRIVVTSDTDAEAVAIAFGCTLVSDPTNELNVAINSGTEAAIAMGCDALLTIPCDVPLVTGDDIRTLFSQDVEIAIVASRDGGTNALLRRPPGAIEPAFGPNSAQLHIDRAMDAGMRRSSLWLESLSLDVDDLRDLQLLASRKEERECVRVAREILAEPKTR